MRHIVLPSDVFPPKCGGAGWSAHALASGLIAQGDDVVAVVPRHSGTIAAPHDVLGVPTIDVPTTRSSNAWLRLLQQSLRLIPRWRDHIAALRRPGQQTIVHAQHLLAAQAAMPLRRADTRVVVTVRDHWPWDMRATGMDMHGDQRTLRGAWRTLARRGAPLIQRIAAPLYAIQMRQRAAILARADLVIAVSQHMAARVQATVPQARVTAIPNMVDISAIAATAQQRPETAVPPAYVLFVGKLATNKGAEYLPALITRCRPPAIVIAGDGPLSEPIAAAAHAAGVPCSILAWVDHDEVLRLMAHADALWFPSSWDEPLSRVLLEALACAAPIIAMPTGGTPEIIIDGVSGLLAPSLDAFVAADGRLRSDPALQAALRAGARAHAQRTYAREVVLQQVTAAYDALWSRP